MGEGLGNLSSPYDHKGKPALDETTWKKPSSMTPGYWSKPNLKSLQLLDSGFLSQPVILYCRLSEVSFLSQGLLTDNLTPLSPPWVNAWVTVRAEHLKSTLCLDCCVCLQGAILDLTPCSRREPSSLSHCSQNTLQSTEFLNVGPDAAGRQHPLVRCKGDQSWVFIGRTDAEAETPVLWPPDVKSWLIGKDPDAGEDWRQEEKGATGDETVGWHHQLNGHEFG